MEDDSSAGHPLSFYGGVIFASFASENDSDRIKD